jgi:hypothetical protein
MAASQEAFDGVIDFDKAIRDPDHPSRVRQDDDSGGPIHPNAAGYKAMAEEADLSVLKGIKPGKVVKAEQGEKNRVANAE